MEYMPNLGAHTFLTCDFNYKKDKAVLQTISYRSIKSICKYVFVKDEGID